MNSTTPDFDGNVPLNLATLDDIVHEFKRRDKTVVIIVSMDPMKGKETTVYDVRYWGRLAEIIGMLLQTTVRMSMLPVSQDLGLTIKTILGNIRKD